MRVPEATRPIDLAPDPDIPSMHCARSQKPDGFDVLADLGATARELPAAQAPCSTVPDLDTTPLSQEGLQAPPLRRGAAVCRPQPR